MHVAVLTINGAIGPLLSLDTHLDSSKTPILSMVVTLTVNTGTSLRLVLGQNGQDAKNDGNASVELDTHKALAS